MEWLCVAKCADCDSKTGKIDLIDMLRFNFFFVSTVVLLAGAYFGFMCGTRRKYAQGLFILACALFYCVVSGFLLLQGT